MTSCPPLARRVRLFKKHGFWWITNVDAQYAGNIFKSWPEALKFLPHWFT